MAERFFATTAMGGKLHLRGTSERLEFHSEQEVDNLLSVYGAIGDCKIKKMDELAAVIVASIGRAVSVRLWIHAELEDTVRRMLGRE
jgi:hypothetical protein